MKNKPVTEYSTEELQKKLRSSTTVYIGLMSIYAGLLVVMLVYAWFRSWDFDMKTPLIIMFLGGFVTTLPLLGARSKFLKELKRRQEVSKAD